MKREWMLWGRWKVLLIYLAVGVVLAAVLGRFGYIKYNDWWYWNGLMEMQSSTSLQQQEIHTVFIRSMVSGFVNQEINLILLTVLVVLSLGMDVWNHRLILMKQLHMSLSRKYLESFLVTAILAFALTLEGFFVQFGRVYPLCAGYLSGTDFWFFIRIIFYLVLVTLCLMSMVQLITILLSELHWSLPLVLAVLGALGLSRSPLLQKIQNYLCWDMPLGVWQEQYVPVIEDAEAVRRWGYFFLAGLVGMTIVCLAVGIAWLQIRYRTRRLESR